MYDEASAVKKYSELRAKIEALILQQKKLEDELELVENEILTDLEESEKTSTAKYSFGSVSLLAPRICATVSKAMFNDILKYLQQIDRTDIIQQTIHSASLGTLISELFENGKPLPLDKISLYLKPQLRWNRPKNNTTQQEVSL